VDSVPSGVTPINASNETIADLELLQRAIDKAVDLGRADVYFVDRGAAQEIESTLPTSAFQEESVAYYILAGDRTVELKIIYYP
jgi:hypothetical protein